MLVYIQYISLLREVVRAHDPSCFRLFVFFISMYGFSTGLTLQANHSLLVWLGSWLKSTFLAFFTGLFLFLLYITFAEFVDIDPFSCSA